MLKKNFLFIEKVPNPDELEKIKKGTYLGIDIGETYAIGCCAIDYAGNGEKVACKNLAVKAKNLAHPRKQYSNWLNSWKNVEENPWVSILEQEQGGEDDVD